MTRKPFFISKSVILHHKCQFSARSNFCSHYSITTLRWPFSDILVANTFISNKKHRADIPAMQQTIKVPTWKTIFTIPQLQTAVIFTFQYYFIILHITRVWVCPNSLIFCWQSLSEIMCCIPESDSWMLQGYASKSCLFNIKIARKCYVNQ